MTKVAGHSQNRSKIDHLKRGVPVDGFSYSSLIFSFIFSPAIINVLRHLPIAVGRLSVCYRYLSFLSTYKSDHHNIHVAEKENCKKDKQWLTKHVTPHRKLKIEQHPPH